jgi:hypothetical protein
MGKKSIRDFSELRTLLKKTETEAEANAEMKKSVGTRKAATLPKRPEPQRRPARLSATDMFIIETIEIKLGQLPADQWPEVRDTLREAMECVSASMVSIKHQLDTIEDHFDEQGRSWKQKAAAALRFKVEEGKQLQQKMQLLDDLIRGGPPPALKLVTTEPTPPTASSSQPAPAYEIRTDVPRPRGHNTKDEWRKYKFAQLEINQSFRFGTETPDQVRRLIHAASRNLQRHFSYRTEPDGVIAVWRIDPSSRRK